MAPGRGGGRSVNVARADRGGGGEGSAREGKCPWKHKPGANQTARALEGGGRSAAPRHKPTFHRRVGVGPVGKHHVHVFQLQPLQRCLQTCGTDGAVRCAEPCASEAQPGTGASSAWAVPSALPLPSMMCFRDRPLSVSALEKERWMRAWGESLARAGCSAAGQVLPTFLPRRFWW